jgi:hypothetical protein
MKCDEKQQKIRNLYTISVIMLGHAYIVNDIILPPGEDNFNSELYKQAGDLHGVLISP